MKKILLFSAFFVSTVLCYSQSNLVNNGSFENYSACPTAFSQVDHATGWVKSYTWNYNTGGWHTELVNSCNGGNWVGVPNNGWGAQSAFDGNGYIAQTTGTPQLQANYRENIYTQLSSPLVPGNQYRVSYRISLSDVCAYASNNICAKFGTDTVFAIDNRAHCVSGVVTDFSGWTLVSDTFIADSAYTYLALGNFFNDANTTYTLAYPSNSNTNNVYYIDSVQVYLIPGKNDITELVGSFSIRLTPNPATDQIMLSGIPQGETGLIEMFSLDGRLVNSWTVNSANGTVVLVLPATCSKGYYFIRFVGETASRPEKLLVE